MSPFTHTQLTAVRDAGPDVGVAAGHEVRFATEALEAEGVGLTHHRMAPDLRPDFAHRHQDAEEVYVVLRGSGRVKLDDEVRPVAEGDAIRVAPTVWRAWESGPQGLEVLAFGPRRPNDGEVTTGFWP